MKKYSLIELYTENKNIVKSVITYDDGSTEQINDIDILKKKIEEFAIQEKITVKELLDDSRKVKEHVIVTTITKVSSPTKEEHDEVKEEPKKENKGFGKKLVKITSIAAALLVAFFAGKGININRKDSKNYKSVTFSEENTLTNDNTLTVNEDSIATYSTRLQELASRKTLVFQKHTG